MDERKLKGVEAVLEEGSFSAAAERLHCTQSAVTQMMNAVESELGVRILERTHRGVSLTREGRELEVYMQNALDSLVFLREAAEWIAKRNEETIRVGTFSSIACRWMPVIIERYQKVAPEAAFDIVIGTTSLKRKLELGEIDVALGDERIRSVRWTRLFEDPYYILVPEKLIDRIGTPEKQRMMHEMMGQRKGADDWTPVPDLFVTKADIAEVPFISATMDDFAELNVRDVSNVITIASDEDKVLMSMAARGLGVCAMPEFNLTEMPADLIAVPYRPEVGRVIGISRPRKSRRAVEQFVTYLEKYYREMEMRQREERVRQEES